MYKQILSVAALVASALALPTITDAPKNIQAGQSYPITWTPSTTASGPVTLLLKAGPNDNLATIGTIASGLTGTSYTWAVPATYANGAYAIEIVQGTEQNYWGGVTYTGGSGAAVSAAASGAASMPAASGAVSAALPSGSAMSAAPRSNTTMTTSHSSSKTSSTATGTKSSTTATASIVSTNSAITLGSPVALILGAFAAMFYLQ